MTGTWTALASPTEVYYRYFIECRCGTEAEAARANCPIIRTCSSELVPSVASQRVLRT